MEVPMSTYKILSDTSCDIPLPWLEKLDVDYVPFHVSFDQEHYLKELRDISPDDFYDKINAEKLYPKTSLPSVQDYMDTMEAALKAGKDVFCMCLTSKFSGSYQSAVNAANILSESYPDRQIYVMDTACVTGSQGLLVYEACRMRDAGFSLAQLRETLEKQKNTTKINFTVDSLDYLQKGGRIGKASALAGTILNIKPIIIMKDGELHPENKVRGHKKALKTIMDMTRNEIGGEKEKYQVLLIRGEKERQATTEAMQQELMAEGFQVLEEVWPVGITIGTHAGPTPIGICYIKKYEYL